MNNAFYIFRYIFYKILLLIIVFYFNNTYCCDKVADRLYNFGQNCLEKILNIIPSTETKKDKMPIVNNNTGDNGDANNDNIDDDLNDNNNDIDNSFKQLIENYYILVAFWGTLLYKIEKANIENPPDTSGIYLENIDLEDKVASFFVEPIENGTTLNFLSAYWSELSDNFIKKDYSFDHIINNICKHNIEVENGGKVVEIIENIKNNVHNNNFKKNYALMWIFVVSFGSAVCSKLSLEIDTCIKNGYYDCEKDERKKRTAKFLKNRFKEYSIQFERIKNMFLFVDNNINCDDKYKKIVEIIFRNMINNIGSRFNERAFANLMYRNFDKDKSHIDLVRNIL